MKPPLPPDEAARLERVRWSGLVGSAPDPDFDGVAALAARACEAPIALVTLIDEDRQWFKARVGTDLEETARDISFCAHAILGEDLLVIPDARLDDRFHDNPLVVGQPFLRFYAGVPVRSPDGLAFGTLCVFDHRPRALSPDQAEALRILGRQVSGQIARRLAEMEIDAIGAERRDHVQMMESLVEGTATTTGASFFPSLARHLAAALSVRYAFVTEFADPAGARLRMLAFWAGRDFAEPVEYDTAGTPCRSVIQGNVAHYRDNLVSRFPEDVDLVALRAESFLGVPMSGASGRILGHLAILDDRPMDISPRALSVLKIFAARAGAELERQRAEDHLREALKEVRGLKARLEAENTYLQEEIREDRHSREIVGSHPSLREALKRIEQVAATPSTVLLLGETGTGKELFARAVHAGSPRSERPLVKVNCGAIPAGLVESELFGHVRGAFTGAHEKRVGRFELADRGTIFLDEIGELPPEMQVKLLRVLQDHEFEPVGSSTTRRVDVRVIAATHRDLEDLVRQGKFRADLLYRLKVFPIPIPPLRERKSDIPLLVGFFLTALSQRMGKPFRGFSPTSLERLTAYDWPGNVRELQNVVERAAILARGPVLDLEEGILVPAASSSPAPRPSRSPAEAERSRTLDALSTCGWVIEGEKGAARALGVHPNTLRNRIKRLGLHRPTHEIS